MCTSKVACSVWSTPLEVILGATDQLMRYLEAFARARTTEYSPQATVHDFFFFAPKTFTSLRLFLSLHFFSVWKSGSDRDGELLKATQQSLKLREQGLGLILFSP